MKFVSILWQFRPFKFMHELANLKLDLAVILREICNAVLDEPRPVFEKIQPGVTRL